MGNSLAVQWLGLCTFTADGVGSIPGWGTKIPPATGHGQKKKIFFLVYMLLLQFRVQYCFLFNYFWGQRGYIPLNSFHRTLLQYLPHTNYKCLNMMWHFQAGSQPELARICQEAYVENTLNYIKRPLYSLIHSVSRYILSAYYVPGSAGFHGHISPSLSLAWEKEQNPHHLLSAS